MELINLLEVLAAKKHPIKERLRKAYMDLKVELGRRPTYVELHLYGNASSSEYKMKKNFGSYVGFLVWAEELTE